MACILKFDINRIPVVVPIAHNNTNIAGYLYVKQKYVPRYLRKPLNTKENI